MNAERERLINWAKQIADPNWCLSVPKEAKDVITQLVKALEVKDTEVAYYKARAAYFKYVPEIENDPEGVQELVEEMRAARKAFLGKETP